MKVVNYEPSSVFSVVGGVKKQRTGLLSKKITTKVQGEGKKTSRLAIHAIPANDFKAYKEDVKSEDRQLMVIGHTKLKQLFSEDDYRSKTESILSVKKYQFEVRSGYKFSRVIAYLPVGEDRFIAIVAINPLFLIIIPLLIIGLIMGVYYSTRPQPEEVIINRYIEEADTSEVNVKPGSTQYKLNTTLTVVKSTIQDLNFENVNEGKYLQLKIKLHEDDEEYVYDSNLVPFGQKVTADTLLRDDVPAGTYKTIAECYVFSLDKKQIAQTNFVVTLIVK